MNEFAFYMPAQVIFGRGKVSEVGKEAQKLGKKGLVVTDKGLLATGLVQRVIDSLESQKADYLVWSDRKSTRLNSSHANESRMPSSA